MDNSSWRKQNHCTNKFDSTNVAAQKRTEARLVQRITKACQEPKHNENRKPEVNEQEHDAAGKERSQE